MQEVDNEILQKEDLLLYIHTPFCGTCHVARAMLQKIESIHDQSLFYEMNASLYPDFMQTYKVKSVPCLFIKVNNKVQEKVYAFRSIGNLYRYLIKYKPELFNQPDVHDQQ